MDPITSYISSKVQGALSADVWSQCDVSPVGIVIPDYFTEDDCQKLLKRATEFEEASRWWIGDILCAAEKKRNGAAKQIAKDVGLSYGAVRQCQHVSSQIPVLRRRNISWSHHYEVASLPPEQQDELLAWAEEGKVSHKLLRLKAAGEKIDQPGKEPRFSPLIKPSDNWNFAPVIYGRIDEDGETHGYIPGEVYVNCFWYYAPQGGEVCDLMAGSGQAMRVYEDREQWAKGKGVEFNLRLFDRLPRGPYKDRIEQLDATKGLPAGYHPDYIFMDIPYFQMVDGAYSDHADDIANMDLPAWSEAMQAVAAACAAAQHPGALCTVMAPNTVCWESGQRIMACDMLRDWWKAAGYELHDIAYSSRRIQQTQTLDMARTNNKAKERRLPLSDIAEIQTFRRIEG